MYYRAAAAADAAFVAVGDGCVDGDNKTTTVSAAATESAAAAAAAATAAVEANVSIIAHGDAPARGRTEKYRHLLHQTAHGYS